MATNLGLYCPDYTHIEVYILSLKGMLIKWVKVI